MSEAARGSISRRDGSRSEVSRQEGGTRAGRVTGVRETGGGDPTSGKPYILAGFSENREETCFDTDVKPTPLPSPMGQYHTRSPDVDGRLHV